MHARMRTYLYFWLRCVICKLNLWRKPKKVAQRGRPDIVRVSCFTDWASRAFAVWCCTGLLPVSVRPRLIYLLARYFFLFYVYRNIVYKTKRQLRSKGPFSSWFEKRPDTKKGPWERSLKNGMQKIFSSILTISYTDRRFGDASCLLNFWQEPLIFGHFSAFLVSQEWKWNLALFFVLLN